MSDLEFLRGNKVTAGIRLGKQSDGKVPINI